METTTISCDDCTMRETTACADCIVTFLCERDPAAALSVDAETRRAFTLLSSAGLVPRLRHRRAS